MNKVIFKICLIVIALFSLTSCRGIEFENQKIAKAEEFSKAEAMIFVAEEKNKYENRFGAAIWNLKSGDGNLSFKDYVVSNVKKFVEKMMELKLVSEDLNITISNQDDEKIKKLAHEYFDELTMDDIDYINCNIDDVEKAYRDYHLSRLVIDNLTKKAGTELSISEAKVIRVQYIVMEDKNLADKTIEDLKAKGANFSYFAKTRSIETNIDMIIKRGDENSTRFPELFYLSDGQVSSILQYKNMYYIFKCVEDYMVEETEDRRLEILKAMKNDEYNENIKKYEEEYNLRSNSTYWKDINLSNGSRCKIYKFEEMYYKYFPRTIK
ncbi:MAG: hypothetical protein II411_05070 [Lachnospiraceae bacterium]|nr:hypothetical protein [Lachnospiraceae bacterium]